MKGEGHQNETDEGQTRMERGLDLVEKYRCPNPPYELSDEDKALYIEASKALNRAWKLKEILGDDVHASAAAEKYAELAGQLAECHDGPWGEESGRLSEEIKDLVSPFLGESVGIGNVLQAASDMKNRPEVFNANVEMIRNGKLNSNVQDALQRLSRAREP